MMLRLEVLARRTPGFTPADIENLMNEAAILTARKREKKIHMETIEEAITKVIAGVAKKSRVISEQDRKLTAYHEAGHAVCMTCTYQCKSSSSSYNNSKRKSWWIYYATSS